MNSLYRPFIHITQDCKENSILYNTVAHRENGMRICVYSEFICTAICYMYSKHKIDL